MLFSPVHAGKLYYSLFMRLADAPTREAVSTGHGVSYVHVRCALEILPDLLAMLNLHADPPEP